MKIKTLNIEEMTGYTSRTTFYEDFSTADNFGALAVRYTYCRAFNAWQNNIASIVWLEIENNNIVKVIDEFGKNIIKRVHVKKDGQEIKRVY